LFVDVLVATWSHQDDFKTFEKAPAYLQHQGDSTILPKTQLLSFYTHPFSTMFSKVLVELYKHHTKGASIKQVSINSIFDVEATTLEAFLKHNKGRRYIIIKLQFTSPQILGRDDPQAVALINFVKLTRRSLG